MIIKMRYVKILCCVVFLAACMFVLGACNSVAISGGDVDARNFLEEDLYPVFPVAGERNSFAIMNDGSLWGWGWMQGIPNSPYDSSYQYFPIPVHIWDGVSYAASSNRNIIFLTEDGGLYGFGDNALRLLSQRLGYISFIEPVNIKNNVLNLSISDSHVLVVDSYNTLWGWGLNFRGQLGDGAEDFSDAPVMIADNVRGICASLGLTSFIDFYGTLWQNNEHGVFVPIFYERAYMVSTSNTHTMIKSENGDLWVLGDNSYNQLGLEGICYTDVPIKIKQDIISITANDNTSYAIDINNSLWVWGNNQGKAAGIEDYETVATPLPLLAMHNVNHISSNDRTTLALKDNSALLEWGVRFLGHQFLDSELVYKTFTEPRKGFYNNFIVDESILMGY